MSNQKIIILDYGVGNVLSLSRAIKKCEKTAILTNDLNKIKEATHIFLPGVGAFKNGMRGLNIRNLVDPIKTHVDQDKPFLGICLGMQMMLNKSYEYGEVEGLNLIEGEVIKIPDRNSANEKHKIPHIGWNEIKYNNNIDNKVSDNDSVYFVHSYMANCKNKENVIASTNYNGIKIEAIIKNKNAYGYQFHPEKSGDVGLEILNNFINL